MALPRDLTSTVERDIESLIEGQAVEGTNLDFKRDIPGRNNEARHEFVADVSAFANASGGDLVYGIEEDGEGRAQAIRPVIGNADEEARRLQDMLLNGVQPRIPGAQIQTVPVAGGFVAIVRVPQSWAGPHRVSTNQHFFIRENGRKRQLDVPEIRGLFLRSDRQAQQIRDFRTERLGAILAGDGPHRLVPGARLVGHFIPTQSALGTVNVDPIQYMEDRALPILSRTIPNARVNADGALVVRNPQPAGTYGYSLLFRNGFFETVKVLEYAENARAQLGSLAYEEEFIALLTRLRAEYQYLGVGLEMTCMVSILNADHVELGINRFDFNLDDHQGFFDRRTLVLPDILLPAEQLPEQALKPAFDLVWQSAGLARSFNYTPDGIWAPRRR
ncbi:AlbA family DNA-binding domain-containing protein [Paraburkholderia caballeronis]|uniref:Putative DNA-binding domain-containing protein n=1 Tax=Paraburkholderia caballeronis TaxID=416943 RepID=A0A1H7L876_9BURK|nr:ATP-binding protein [Paraburkholderia caballeronis]PXW28343.1 putative DNA-binding protein [Paraburkholderia caballeronis]PXX03709.1 putative DNA-binding protein [Paraburkholderia caballeronis]RAK04453.1 putative DNA-binding protein [Paraburkholderia caballeronis]SED79480.1 Putative DNA-binding domain-containing protein [Paraburkholderia caballeronis]SEK95253.1 Putative DNA-binding domain-containing protein [Paraburkholderia caballeronis]